jgi:serine/threonine-protein kinase HipA
MSHKCYICYKNDIPDDQPYHQECVKRVFGVENAPEIPYSLDEMKELAKRIIQVRSAITGVQPKISLGFERANREKRRLTVMTGEYILKPPNAAYPEMPENEDLTMHLADVAMIKTVPHALISLSSGELAYITRRMDRRSTGKIHMEDFHQLLGVDDKYKSSMEGVGRIIKKYSFLSSTDIVTVFELTLFCFVTGNADMHLKNFSLIEHKNKCFALANAYDLLNTKILLPNDPEEMAMPVNGKKVKIKLSDFKALSENYGLDQTQFTTAVRNILAKKEHFLKLINSSFLDDENKEKYSALILSRMQRLEGG